MRTSRVNRVVFTKTKKPMAPVQLAIFPKKYANEWYELVTYTSVKKKVIQGLVYNNVMKKLNR